MATKHRGHHRTIRITRDAATFTVGLAIIVQQVIVGSASNDRPYVLAVAAAMIGLPVFSQLIPRNGGST